MGTIGRTNPGNQAKGLDHRRVSWRARWLYSGGWRWRFYPDDMRPSNRHSCCRFRTRFSQVRGLYGPFDGHYPLVLIHAPLYYRVAGMTGGCSTARASTP